MPTKPPASPAVRFTTPEQRQEALARLALLKLGVDDETADRVVARMQELRRERAARVSAEMEAVVSS